jgi:hypothetical protein
LFLFQILCSLYNFSRCILLFFSCILSLLLLIFFLLLLFIHSLLVCLTTGPKPLPKRAVHIVRSRASSFRCEYPLIYLRSSSRILRFLPCIPLFSIPPYIFTSVT